MNAARNGSLGAQRLGIDRRLAALYKIAAHDADHRIQSQCFFCFQNLILMSVMKRIIFTYDRTDLQYSATCLWKSYEINRIFDFLLLV